MGIATKQSRYLEYKVGDVVLGVDIGKAKGMRFNKFMLQACTECGERRWVLMEKNGQPRSTLCHACGLKGRKQNHPSGPNHPYWQGGRHLTPYGYVLIKVFPDNFFWPMATKNGYILEHRLVMAKHLGRCLHPWEVVHHKNGIRDDNRLENLELNDSAGEHSLEHHKGYSDGLAKGFRDGRSQRIKQLEAEIATLKAQLTSQKV